MSMLARKLMRRSGKKLVTGTLSGSGNLSIPAGVVSVSLTGQGGVGGDDSWYDPGQPYIAPSGYHPEVAAQPAMYTGWDGPYAGSLNGLTGSLSQMQGMGASNGVFNGGSPAGYGSTSSPPGNYSVWGYQGTSTPGVYAFISYYWTPHQSSAAVAYQAAYYDYPGQPYIAPSSGGGPYYGTSTTATLNGSTLTWQGGYGAGVQGAVLAKTAASTGAGQTLSYSCASGTSMIYSYEV